MVNLAAQAGVSIPLSIQPLITILILLGLETSENCNKYGINQQFMQVVAQYMAGTLNYHSLRRIV